MTKWLTYLGILLVLIVITIISITGTKAGFLIVENCEYEYQPCSIEEKFTLRFHGHKEPIKPFPVTDEILPEGLVWQNGADQQPFADPAAKRGGTWNTFIESFPQTLRQRGMNANFSFRLYLDLNDQDLLDIHPATDAFIPALAREWAIGPDKRTVYYRIDPDAQWSDGVPVTADDWVCMLKLYRAPGIVDPYTSNYFTEYVEDILKFDDHTIGVRVPKRQPNIVLSTMMAPVPYHFYGNFLQKEHSFRGKTAYYTLKNNKLPIPEELKYYQIQEQLESLEIFIISMTSKLEIVPNKETVGKAALLRETMSALSEAGQLTCTLSEANKTNARRQLEDLTSYLDRYTVRLDSIKPTEDQAENPYAVTDDDVAAGLAALEAFVVSLKSKLKEGMDKEAFLKEVADTLAEAIRLTDTLAEIDKAEATRQLKEIVTRFDRFTAKLATIEPTSEQAKESHTITIDDVAPGWNKTFNWRAKPNTGPYQISKFMRGKWILFKRNANWWSNDHKFYKYRYNPDYRRIRVISKPEIAFEYFKQGALDSFGLTLAEYWHKKAADIPQYENGYVEKRWLWNDIPRPSWQISMNLEMELLKDKNVRLGIAHALNIQKMIDLAMLGDAEQANTISTGYREYTNTDLRARAFDIEKATGYLEKAGWTRIGADGIRIKDGQRLSIKFLYSSPAQKGNIMILKEEAAKAGIEFKPETYDSNTVFKFLQDKKHEMVWHGWGQRHHLTGPTYYGSYHSDNAGTPNNNNLCNFGDPEVDRLIETYRNNNEEEERKKLAKELQARIHEACIAIPTYYITFSRSIAWRWVRIPDAAETPSSEFITDFSLYWIDEEMKRETLDAMKEGKTFPRTLRVYEKNKPEPAE